MDITPVLWLKCVHYVTCGKILVDEVLWSDSPAFCLFAGFHKPPSEDGVLVNVKNLYKAPAFQRPLDVFSCHIKVLECPIQQEGLPLLNSEIQDFFDQNRDATLKQSGVPTRICSELVTKLIRINPKNRGISKKIH